MKTKMITFVSILAMSFAVNAQIDRTKIPKAGPAPKIQLKKAIKFTLTNGMQIIMVENHKLPRVTATLTIDNKPVLERENAGMLSIMGNLIGRGTASITKDDFNEKVDYLGANVNFNSTGAFARSLTKYFPEILNLMADGVKNSQFTQEEFDKEVKITLDGIKASEKSVTAVARRVEDALLFGKNHPLGEFITKESVNNITLNKVKNYYNTYYKPNNAYLVVVGDINPKETRKLIENAFGNWKKGIIPVENYSKPKNVANTEINFINMPNAVQSEIAVANTIDLKLGDPDFYAALLANQILGGGGTARLFQNLREDKGYTYGSYSTVNQSRYAGSFKATASVRNIVTDSSVVELQKEINKIRYQKVSEKELKDAKEKYLGNFIMNVQKPETAARYALNIARYNLPENFYENYITNINNVTVNDVQNAAIKYFRGDKARIIITGKGIEVLKNLEKGDYTIRYFDAFANPTQKPEMTLPIPKDVTATTVVDNYIKAIGGKDKIAAVNSLLLISEGKVQGIDLVVSQKTMAPNKSLVTIEGMGMTLQKIMFDGEKGYQEAQGNRKDFDGKEIEKIKNTSAPFSDFAYKKGTLERIEPINGSYAYVIKYTDSEIFYDKESGLKIKEIKTVETPQGKVKIPTTFSNYKEVKGIKFPHTIGQKMGPVDLTLTLKEVKVNEGVSTTDFQ